MNISKEHRKIVGEISLLKKEQSKISIVKEFAKHAKLQRKINKLNEQLKNHGRFTCMITLYFIPIGYCYILRIIYYSKYLFFSKRKFI